MKSFGRNLLQVFLRKAVRYLIILMIMILVIIPILTATQRNIYRSTLSLYQHDVEKSAYDLQNKLNTVMTLGSLISEDTNYRAILSAADGPSNRHVVNMINLQKTLFYMSLPNSFIQDMYILFDNNDLYISNHIISQDFRTVFPSMYDSGEESAESWRDAVLNQPDSLCISTGRIISQYSFPRDYEALTLILNITPDVLYSRQAKLVCHMNLIEMLENGIRDDIRDNYFLYIDDQDGHIIVSRNFESSAPVTGDTWKSPSGDTYVLVKSALSDYGYDLCVGIPSHHFYEITDQSVRMLIGYVVIGSVIVLTLTFLYCLIDTRKYKKVVDSALSLLPFVNKPEPAANEASYMNKVITASASQLNSLQEELKNHALANLFFFPPSPERIPGLEEMFGDRFDSFCTVILRLNPVINGQPMQQAMFSLSKLLRKLPMPFLCTYTDRTEISVLLNLKKYTWNEQQLSAAFSRIIQEAQGKTEQNDLLIHVGISQPASGLQNVYVAYNQAKTAINMNADRHESGVYFYVVSKEPQRLLCIDLSQMSKFSESILCGDTNSLLAFFAEVRQSVQQGAMSFQEQGQLLYSIRQPLYSSYLEIHSMVAQDDPLPPFPDLQLKESLRVNLDLLEKTAYDLCNRVNAQRKMRTLRFKDEIMDYIYSNCYDANFTIHMVAEAHQVSESYVNNLVKEVTGKNLKAFIENLRIDKAEKMLRQKTFTNAYITQECGFGSENTFYRAFSRRHGLTPGKWMEQFQDT